MSRTKSLLKWQNYKFKKFVSLLAIRPEIAKICHCEKTKFSKQNKRSGASAQHEAGLDEPQAKSIQQTAKPFYKKQYFKIYNLKTLYGVTGLLRSLMLTRNDRLFANLHCGYFTTGDCFEVASQLLAMTNYINSLPLSLQEKRRISNSNL